MSVWKALNGINKMWNGSKNINACVVLIHVPLMCPIYFEQTKKLPSVMDTSPCGMKYSLKKLLIFDLPIVYPNNLQGHGSMKLFFISSSAQSILVLHN